MGKNKSKKNPITNNIRKLRFFNDEMTQQELAEKVGVTRQTIIAMEKGKYKLGEGVTGRVIQTGKSIAIPKISEEPAFLNRTASRRIKGMGEISFICVPVQKGKQVVGALSVPGGRSV